jgi:hypothetical protein
VTLNVTLLFGDGLSLRTLAIVPMAIAGFASTETTTAEMPTTARLALFSPIMERSLFRDL